MALSPHHRSSLPHPRYGWPWSCEACRPSIGAWIRGSKNHGAPVSTVVVDAPIVLRPAREADMALIIDSWVRSYRKQRQNIDATTYGTGQRKLINRLLDGRTALLVAAFDEHDDDVWGWSCTSTGTVHYVWVRLEYRSKGIAKRLLAPYLNKPAIYTHACKGAPKLWTYDPYHAFELAYSHRKETVHEAA